MNKTIINMEEMSDSKEFYSQRPNPIIPAFIYGLIGLLVIAIVYCCFGKIEIVAHANGVVRPNDDVSTISSLISGRITGVHYGNGQIVKEEDVLLTVDTSELQISLDSLKSGKEDYENQISMLERFLDGIENGKNPFSSDSSSDEYPYYVQYQDYALSLKNSKKNFDYDVGTVKAKINTSNERIKTLQDQIDGLSSYKESVQQGQNLATQYPEYEKLYQLYQSNCAALEADYQSQREKIFLDSTEERNIYYQAYYEQQLSSYDHLIQSIEKGSSQFDEEDDAVCKLLYSDYQNSMSEYKRSYENARDTYNYYQNGGDGDNFSDLLAYDRVMLEGYNYYKQSIESNTDSFVEGRDSIYYRTLYEKYLLEYVPIKAAAEDAAATYDSVLSDSGATENEIDMALDRKNAAEKAATDYKSAAIAEAKNRILEIEASIAQKEISIGSSTQSLNLNAARTEMESAEAAMGVYKTQMLSKYQQIKADIESKRTELNISAGSVQDKDTQLKNLEESYRNSKQQQYYQTVSQIDNLIQSATTELASAKSGLRLYQITDEMYSKNVDEGGKPITISMAMVEQVSDLLGKEESLTVKLDELNTKIQQIETQIEQGIIYAEQTGVINEIVSVTKGDMIASGATIATIIPVNESEYKVRLYVSNSDIANLEVGDHIKYSLAAMPSNQYGVVDGYVTGISSDTLVQDGQYSGYYLVEGSIENAELSDKDGNVGNIAVGMQVEAKIVTQKKAILRFLLEKINLF